MNRWWRGETGDRRVLLHHRGRDAWGGTGDGHLTGDRIVEELARGVGVSFQVAARVGIGV